MPRLYIYYRVEPRALPALRATWASLRDRWQARHPSLRGELLVRADQRAGQPAEDGASGSLTLMEIWSLDVPPSPGEEAAEWLPAMEQDLASALAGHIQGPRHIEHFEPLPG